MKRLRWLYILRIAKLETSFLVHTVFMKADT